MKKIIKLFSCLQNYKSYPYLKKIIKFFSMEHHVKSKFYKFVYITYYKVKLIEIYISCINCNLYKVKSIEHFV